MFFEGLYRHALRFLLLFGDILLQVLAMTYLSLHKSALGFFEAILMQVLVHNLSHPSL